MSRRKTGFPPEVKDAVLARSGGNCEAMLMPMCSFVGEQIHHRRPRSMGGTRRETTTLPSNALVLCSRCHAHIEGHRAWALEHGFLVRQAADPREVSVVWRGQVRTLDDVGGFDVQAVAS